MAKLKKKKRSLAPEARRQLLEDVEQIRGLLAEVCEARLEILERKTTKSGKPGGLRVRGEFARVGEPTENKRVYEQRLWEREIARLQPQFPARKVFGELDHPDDGRTRLQRVSHIVTDLRIENGVVVGEAEILPTQQGRNLAALLEAGCKVGVSSRGYGTTKPNNKGEEVVQDDYKLATFDFVADPADSNAYPEIFGESLIDQRVLVDGNMLFEGLQFEGVETEEEEEDDEPEHVEEDIVDRDALRVELRTELEAELRTELREKITESVMAGLVEERAKLAEELRAELLSDPELLSESMAEKDSEIIHLRETVEEVQQQASLLSAEVTRLEEANAELAAMVRKLGIKYFVERALADHPHAEVIREGLGDPDQYESVEAFKQAFSALETRAIEEEKQRARLEAERRALQERANAERDRLLEENKKLSEACHRTLQVAKMMGVQLYAEERISRHPRATNIRAILRQVQPSTKEEVDAVIEEFRAPSRSPEEIEQTAARIRQLTGGGVSALPRMEEEPWQPAESQALVERRQPGARGEGWNGLGTALDELRRYMPGDDQ